MTDQEKRGGYLVAIATEAMARMGYGVEVSYLPWARAINQVLHETGEGLLGAYYTADRARILAYSDPMAESELVFFTLRGSGITSARLASLEPHAIGTVRGTRYPEAFEQAQRLRKIPANTFEVNVKNLLAGRIPVILEKRRVVQDYLGRLAPSEASRVVGLAPPLATERFYVCFAKDDPAGRARLRDFNRGLALIRKDGSYRRILAGKRHE
ncbi:MAG TPA: transporter substrate-binding domain-containing protein [Holophaga sp.]|nr:transporter substrate-binding domain-containing protein [Holophaga sp.]